MITDRGCNFESKLSQSCVILTVHASSCHCQMPLFQPIHTTEANYPLAAITALQSVPGPHAPQKDTVRTHAACPTR
eukprot:COSAG02_NODE_54_length_43941_cov_54.857990_20_plen_76_part_00